ncbi:protein kinase domain-containing protein [Streptomyces shenzhenensis]|uniref:serine/threonine-protein kinase n=1 Tax=Streptomyces shenzhenensis TaxID=943815 RepID=UPI003D8C7354
MAMAETQVRAHEWPAGRYRLLEVVQRGTNRVCWYAEDAATGRPRLVTRVELPAGGTPETGRLTAARVLRASEVMARLCPGRVATVLDAVEEAGALWTVAEWIDGMPLDELLARQGTLPYARAARIGLELLDVLEAAHGEGVTHGELSPGQVFVRAEGPVVVTGFGWAGATLVPRVTAPSYASPEQARDQRIGPAADLWALGAILYTMTEGRPPFRDRGGPEATLRGVDRLPLRTPLRAGPLTPAVQGLLRKESGERLPRPLAREALTRVLAEDARDGTPTGPGARLRAAVRRTGRGWGGRTVAAGTALAVVTVSGAVLYATRDLPGTEPSAAVPPPRTSAAPTPTGSSPAAAPTPAPTASATAPAAPGGNVLPNGYRGHTAPEGFTVALPDGWKRLRTARGGDHSYRVTYGPGGSDPRTLSVTYSERLGPDPVAVWRDDVQPGLERLGGFHRIGTVRATRYQGYEAADMEWLSGTGSDRVRTFGRGFLLGGHRGYSLRFTAPAGAWDSADSRSALDTFLRTFRAQDN